MIGWISLSQSLLTFKTSYVFGLPDDPSLIKSSVSVPGISDHDIVVTDADIKPIYTRQKPRKVYKWKQANWDNIKKDCEKLSNRVCEEAKGNADIEKLWNTFKDSINSSVEKNVPSKTCRNKYSLPWVNRRLKRSMKTKARLHKQAKKVENGTGIGNFKKNAKGNLDKQNINILTLLFKKVWTVITLNHFGNM